MGELQFITISSDPKLASQDTESRRLIRTTATRATRSQNAHELSDKHRAQSDVVRATTLRGRTTRFRLKQTNNKSISKNNKPEPALHVSPIDAQLPLWDPVVTPLGGQAWLLLHYYRYLFRTRSWALNAKRDWFAFVIEDHAATHATLAFVSLNRDLEEGSLISATTLHHRTRAIQLVRRRLAESKGTVEDSLIGAVALLSITEGLEGQPSSSRLHAQALQKLVDLRGGFNNFDSNEALSRIISWADLCHTSAFVNHTQSSRPTLSSDLSLCIDDAAFDPVTHSKFHEAVKRTMSSKTNDLVKLLATVPRYPPTDRTSVDERRNTSRIISHMNQLMMSIYSDKLSLGPGSTDRYERVLCYTAHLYISLVLTQMPRRTKIVIERASKLHDSIREVDQRSSQGTALEEPHHLIMLWAHTVHYCSLFSHDQKESVVAPVKNAIKALRVKNFEELEEKLGRISWINGYAEDDLKLLFREYDH